MSFVTPGNAAAAATIYAAADPALSAAADLFRRFAAGGGGLSAGAEGFTTISFVAFFDRPDKRILRE
jgi:hypothetical protein